MHVGFVGTGNMGRPMAQNILKAGHQLTVYDLSAAATAPLERLGAVRVADLPSLARAVRVTLMSLPDAAAVDAALLGGALTLAILIARRCPLPATLTSIGWIGRLHDSKSGVPYGIALAVA
ncbi:MAG: NAD(P)-binding domain-containing protein, partial [Candidatus Rokubacteria bacterium]|nr:NAD(P)-binding domain-containing protein [Candidatus Rokubacteria bacterium]